MIKAQFRTLSRKPVRSRRLSSLMLVGMSVPLILALIAGTAFLVTRLQTRAAEVNGNCTLIVPPNPLSARGLATPYQMLPTNMADGPCNEANADQAAFVQAAILNPATGAVSIYHPLVIDQNTKPAIAPRPPQLPQNAIVGIWFGFNGDTITLRGKDGSLQQGRCVNGVNGSLFGQFAYCNAPAFFAAANAAVRAGRLKIPPIGTANDGMPCPTIRDFSIVDMDQSDNLTTVYLISNDGRMAQRTAANMAALPGAKLQINGSDNALLNIHINRALGCKSWLAPDLGDNNRMVPSLALNELQAAAQQAPPSAIIPAGDPMVLVNGQPSLAKLNAYRRGVNQPMVGSLNNASTTTYCTNILNVAPARLKLDADRFKGRPSPDPGAANSLFTFVAQRLNGAYGEDGLNCPAMINQPNPIKLIANDEGVVTDAEITVPNGGNSSNKKLNCVFNGTMVAGCNGTITINGQTCTLGLDNAARRVNITCMNPTQGQQQGDQDQQQGNQEGDKEGQ
jgi:hypothetical protein